MLDSVGKNYYLALLFKDRPDLHMTMRYWKDLHPGDLVRKIKETEANMLDSQEIGLPIEQFPANFPFPDVFGWAKKVKVLRSQPTQPWPQFILNLVLPSAVGNFHITCNDIGPLVLTACAVAIMRRKDEVCRWNLGEPSQNQPKAVQKDLFCE